MAGTQGTKEQLFNNITYMKKQAFLETNFYIAISYLKGTFFQIFKLIHFTHKANKLSFQIIRAFLFSLTKTHFVETVLKMIIILIVIIV